MVRKAARENAFILIFESICKKEETAEEIYSKATEIRGLEADEYVKCAFFGSYENADVVDSTADKYLVGWKKERVSLVARAILRLAVYEIMFVDDIPGRVSINEAIELSKKYDDDKAYSFINGVLNAVAEAYGKK